MRVDIYYNNSWHQGTDYFQTNSYLSIFNTVKTFKLSSTEGYPITNIRVVSTFKVSQYTDGHVNDTRISPGFTVKTISATQFMSTAPQPVSGEVNYMLIS